MSELRLTEAVTSESLRMRVAPILPVRRAETDFEVEGITIPQGTFVAPTAGAIHRSDALFLEPDTYNPHRWLELGSSADSHTFFLSFGASSHKCPGRLFALAEIKTMLACLLMQYRFTGGLKVSKRSDRAEECLITMNVL